MGRVYVVLVAVVLGGGAGGGGGGEAPLGRPGLRPAPERHCV